MPIAARNTRVSYLQNFTVESNFGWTSLKQRLVTRALLALATASTLLLVGFQPAHAATESVLYSFGAYSGDGQTPSAPLIMDASGNFYGTTSLGGNVNCTYEGFPAGCGTVFKLSPTGKETLLYSFCPQPNCTDGMNPYSGLIMDKQGNLYGTTINGGANGWGTVFKLTASGQESLLHSFANNSGDGGWPQGGLVMDQNGNLYGTTALGGSGGTVFKIDANGNESVFYWFGSHSGDGNNPAAPLMIDKQGNLYGTTTGGGTNGTGTVFEITPSGQETVLYSFGAYNSGDGINPFTPVVMDNSGNLYGTTSAGGTKQDGVVFKLTPSGQETVLHSFGTGPNDGIGPTDLILDKRGNLYGTTTLGSGSSYGTVFKLTPAGKETVLHQFIPNTGDGYDPQAGLVRDKKGHLYGTTAAGGAYGYGTVFKIGR